MRSVLLLKVRRYLREQTLQSLVLARNLFTLNLVPNWVTQTLHLLLLLRQVYQQVCQFAVLVRGQTLVKSREPRLYLSTSIAQSYSLV